MTEPTILIALLSFALSLAGASIGMVLGQIRLPLIIAVLGSISLGAGTNLAISALGALAGSYKHLRDGHVDRKLFLTIGIPSVLSAALFSQIASRLNKDWTCILLGFTLSIMGLSAIWRTLREKEMWISRQSLQSLPETSGRHLAREIAVGSVLGGLSSIVGLMMGGVRATAMIRWLGIEPHVAVGTNLAIGAVTGLAATAVAVHSSSINISILAAAAPATMVGAYLGARLTDRIPVFKAGEEQKVKKIKVGRRPNGLAFDPSRGTLLAANTGSSGPQEPYTVSVVDMNRKEMIKDLPVPGRTRWSVFDNESDAFYVNIAKPAQIAVLDAKDPTKIQRTIDIPSSGPHGLDMDAKTSRLFCATDGKHLVTVDAKTGKVLNRADLSGKPDVVFFNPARNRLYVAIEDPGVIDVFDTTTMKKVETVPTEKGAHTMAFDASTNKVYVFYQDTHRAAVFFDQ